MDDVIQMQFICTVQALQKSVYGKQDSYDSLKKYSVERLMEIRDELIPGHNEVIEARRFAAEVIYG